MKGVFIGLAVVVVVVVGGFTTLLVIADANTPEPEEIRIEVSDDIRSSG